jgi:hypothetical protein
MTEPAVSISSHHVLYGKRNSLPITPGMTTTSMTTIRTSSSNGTTIKETVWGSSPSTPIGAVIDLPGGGVSGVSGSSSSFYSYSTPNEADGNVDALLLKELQSLKHRIAEKDRIIAEKEEAIRSLSLRLATGQASRELEGSSLLVAIKEKKDAVEVVRALEKGEVHIDAKDSGSWVSSTIYSSLGNGHESEMLDR